MPVAVLPSCRIVVWNRMTSDLVLEHRDDIAGRVLEPGDRRSLRATRDPLLVLLEVGIPLHPDPGRDEAVDGGIDIGHREIEDREVRRGMVGLRVDQDGRGAAEMELEQAPFARVADIEPEGVAVEGPRGLDIRDGEAGEGGGVVEHRGPPVIVGNRARTAVVWSWSTVAWLGASVTSSRRSAPTGARARTARRRAAAPQTYRSYASGWRGS